ncbi:hypothetical protein [Pelomonas cellulosilytica]|uniref:Uncharacterized protein n=1 Tax=Pelomonas cellulosilytica TaxID=2906762 RepID=A0ABS8Y090_9BURK|nr:hypothetical protein [Pelomonas sp. P8]MCE4556998.1 hypothetical protein [Pelomonas sp. P8]
MEPHTQLLAVLAAALATATWLAWRENNDRRDIALLGGVSGLLGAGAAVSAVL